MNLTLGVVGISALVLTGCKKDDPTPEVVTSPVIVLTSPVDGESKISGTTLTLAFTANTDNGIKRVVIKYKSATGSEIVKLDSIIVAQPTSFAFSRNYTVGAIGTESYTMVVTDKKDNIQTKSINIKSITGFADETFGKFYHILGSNSGAFDLMKSESRLGSDADADKDMVNTDATTVFSGAFTAKNLTMFVKSATFNYNNGTTIEAANEYASGTPSATVSLPVNGDIYIAKLRNTNTYVIVKIIANEPTNDECGCTNKGKLTFNLKKSL